METPPGSTLDAHSSPKPTITKPTGTSSIYRPITAKSTFQLALRHAPYQPRSSLTHSLLRSKATSRPKTTVPTTTTTLAKLPSSPRPPTIWPPSAIPRPPSTSPPPSLLALPPLTIGQRSLPRPPPPQLPPKRLPLPLTSRSTRTRLVRPQAQSKYAAKPRGIMSPTDEWTHVAAYTPGPNLPHHSHSAFAFDGRPKWATRYPSREPH